MKDVLLKIAESCYDEETTIDDEGNIEGGRLTFNKDKYATEIADIVKAFAEWIGYNCTHGDLVYIQLTTDWIYKNKGYTYNGLYEFWYNEIREKWK